MPPPFVADKELRFLFRLARDLGMTVAELSERLSSYEFAAWAAFYRREEQEQERALRKAQQRTRR